MDSLKSKLSTIIFIAMLAASVSFLMPYANIPYVDFSLSGLDFFKIADLLKQAAAYFDLDMDVVWLLYVGLGGSILGALGTLICRANDYKMIFPLVVSGVCLWSMSSFFSELERYLEIGYSVFTLAHTVSVILCIVSLVVDALSASPLASYLPARNTSQNGGLHLEGNAGDYVMRTPQSDKPKVAPVTPARWKCVHCNSENPMEKSLCRTCGKPRFSEEEQKPSVPQSNVAAENKSAQQTMTSWFCPSCGTKNGHTEPFCFNCGFKYVR